MKAVIFALILFVASVILDASAYVRVPLFVFFLIMVLGYFANRKRHNGKLTITVSGEPSYHTKIAGVQHRCDHQDVGGFLGYIKPNPDNPHDPNAIAIYRNGGKHLGYIPKDETNALRRWSAKEKLPCVGFIKEGDEVPLFGKVKVLDTSPEEAELEVAKYVRWMVSQFGLGFVPEGFSMDPVPTSKKQALEIMDEYIENKEAEIYEEDSDE